MTAQDIRALPRAYRLTVADYLTLDRNGAFEGLRTELIEGEIIVMSPQTARHIRVKTELGFRLRLALEGLATSLRVGIDGSVVVGERSFPEPDVFIADAFPDDGYVQSGSVRLVVEVAISSLELDLNSKQRLYAQHGIAEYWVVDVDGGKIHQMWAPAGEAFSRRREVAFGEVMEAVTIQGLRVESGGLA